MMGVRSLCNGIGPALFGLFFFLFDVDLYYNEMLPHDKDLILSNKTSRSPNDLNTRVSIIKMNNPFVKDQIVLEKRKVIRLRYANKFVNHKFYLMFSIFLFQSKA